MKGDYFRYLAEVATGNDRKEIMNQSQEAYKGAFEVAQKEMPVRFFIPQEKRRKNLLIKH